MTHNEIREKVLAGTTLAIEKLIEERARENGYLVFSRNGKVVKVNARDLLKERKEKGAN